jgi:hypothetical protein
MEGCKKSPRARDQTGFQSLYPRVAGYTAQVPTAQSWTVRIATGRRLQKIAPSLTRPRNDDVQKSQPRLEGRCGIATARTPLASTAIAPSLRAPHPAPVRTGVRDSTTSTPPAYLHRASHHLVDTCTNDAQLSGLLCGQWRIHSKGGDALPRWRTTTRPQAPSSPQNPPALGQRLWGHRTTRETMSAVVAIV